MSPGDLAGVLSSPPYSSGTVAAFDKDKPEEVVRAWYEKYSASGGGMTWENFLVSVRSGRRAGMQDYGTSPGQIGNTGSIFWEAARDILLACHRCLRPGAATAWVTKDFCRAGERVCFSDDWQRLLEATGYRVLLRVRSSLVKVDSHPGLFGGNVERKRERKSFFRRLAERHGSPAIDHEDVIWAVKEESQP